MQPELKEPTKPNIFVRFLALIGIRTRTQRLYEHDYDMYEVRKAVQKVREYQAEIKRKAKEIEVAEIKRKAAVSSYSTPAPKPVPTSTASFVQPTWNPMTKQHEVRRDDGLDLTTAVVAYYLLNAASEPPKPQEVVKEAQVSAPSYEPPACDPEPSSRSSSSSWGSSDSYSSSSCGSDSYSSSDSSSSSSSSWD